MTPGPNDRTEPGTEQQDRRPDPSQTDVPTNDFGGASSLGHDVSQAVRNTAAGPDLFADTAHYPMEFGPYELLGELARGGMGVVYRARQRGLGRTVALKMILGGADVHPSSVRRLELEAKAAAALDHPNVVPIYDTGEVNGRRYFTMAFVDGPNLKGHVDARGRPTVAEAVRLFAQIVDGVAHAHRHGVIHRDLKPANVLIDKDGRPRVTDFGLAKKQDTDGELTRTGQVMGTPQYMSPEQARGTKDAGKPADVYSLGAILYYLLVNRPPLVGESVTDLLVKVVTETPKSPREVNPDVPRDVDAVCMKCLAKNPADRFPDALALAAVIGPIADRYTRRSTTEVDLEAHGIKLPKGAGTPPAPRPPVPDTAPDPTPIALDPPPAASPLLVPETPRPTSTGKAPLVLAGIAAVAAAAAVAVVMLRPPAKEKDPAGDKPAAATPPVIKAAGPKADAPFAQAALPPVTRRDFGLTVDVGVSGPTTTDAAGVRLIPAGATTTFRLSAGTRCHVVIYTFDPAGDALQLFPNEFDRDNLLVPGASRAVPPDRPLPAVRPYTIDNDETAGPGFETIRVVAVSPDPVLLPRAKELAGGRFPWFRGPEQRQVVVNAIRGMVARPVAETDPAKAGPEKVSEYELRYRVVR
jgi:serine/threonine protein kinase